MYKIPLNTKKVFDSPAAFLKILFLIFSALLFTLFSQVQVLSAQNISTFVDTDSVRVGDTINLSITLEGEYTLHSYPGEEAFPEDLELLERQRFQTATEGDSLVYTLQYFGLEDLEITSLPLELNVAGTDTTLQSNRVPLFFKSTLSGEDDTLRPFKPIFEFAREYWPYILGLILLAILGYFIARYLKARARKDVFVPESFTETPFRNPFDELEEAIMNLESGPRPENEEEFERFYVRLADSIRAYLKRVYEFPALEMTSGEIVDELQRQRASSDLIRTVRNVLNEADMVKFARFNPASDQVSDAIRTGIDFLETVRTIDHERVQYLKHRHEEAQREMREAHEAEQQKRREEFEQ